MRFGGGQPLRPSLAKAISFKIAGVAFAA
ncbi:hypothetical protein NSND_60720 [Nitrospira sp. ND1]|nr:hypothetical protein NSND_60720 [Nitrospira sp. ND1]